MITVREHVHRLVDELTPDELAEAACLLDELRAERNPAWRAAAAAPEDDEPLTPEDEAAIVEGLADFSAGRVVTDDELHRALGIQLPDGAPY